MHLLPATADEIAAQNTKPSTCTATTETAGAMDRQSGL
jgi:hypothetical protein